MRKFIGTLLTWLLLLAIPLQGQAATAVQFCGEGHHGVLAQADVQPVSGHYTETVATANFSQREWTAGGALGNNQVASASLAQVGESTVGHASGDDKCSAYSVIVGTPSVVPLLATVAEPIPYALESFVNCIPKRLNPPPRAVLA